MSFVWIEKSKRNLARALPASTETAATSLEMATFERARHSQIPGSFPPSGDVPTNTAITIVYVKAAVCRKCGFSEEAEEDYVLFHCENEMRVTTIAYEEKTRLPPVDETKVQATPGGKTCPQVRNERGSFAVVQKALMIGVWMETLTLYQRSCNACLQGSKADGVDRKWTSTHISRIQSLQH